MWKTALQGIWRGFQCRKERMLESRKGIGCCMDGRTSYHCPTWSPAEVWFSINGPFFTFSRMPRVRVIGEVVSLKTEGCKPVFMAAKTHVIPESQKGIVPRVELQVALVTIRLAKPILQSFQALTSGICVSWKVSLYYGGSNDEDHFDVFFGNRVSGIQNI